MNLNDIRYAYYLKVEGEDFWTPVTQKLYQSVERLCGFNASKGQDATAGFSTAISGIMGKREFVPAYTATLDNASTKAFHGNKVQGKILGGKPDV